MRHWLIGLILILQVQGFTKLKVTSGSDVLPASVQTPAVIEVWDRGAFGKKKITDFTAEAQPVGKVRFLKTGNLLYIFSLALTNTGAVDIMIKRGKEVQTNRFRFMLSAADSDSDGYPDAADIPDGSAFRDWFCSIAESQFYSPGDTWFDVNKDCGGLVEFAFREALKKHDAAWFKKIRYLPDGSLPDSRPYYFPDVPFLGNRIFRVKGGAFDQAKVTNDFAGTASGSVLRTYCLKLISRDVKGLKKGQMLFYFHSGNLKMPSHAMIYIGGASDPMDGYVIYHTGPGDKTKGEMRKVRLKDLMRHPDPSWRPSVENQEFLGFYDWKILK